MLPCRDCVLAEPEHQSCSAESGKTKECSDKVKKSSEKIPTDWHQGNGLGFGFNEWDEEF